jgi:hypothetical protein
MADNIIEVKKPTSNSWHEQEFEEIGEIVKISKMTKELAQPFKDKTRPIITVKDDCADTNSLSYISYA